MHKQHNSNVKKPHFKRLEPPKLLLSIGVLDQNLAPLQKLDNHILIQNPRNTINVKPQVFLN